MYDNITTNLIRREVARMGSYTASKAGIESLTRIAAIEHSKTGIRINAINQGAFDTPMLHRMFPNKKDLLLISEQNPTGRIALPEDIARTVLWLFSQCTYMGASLLLMEYVL